MAHRVLGSRPPERCKLGGQTGPGQVAADEPKQQPEAVSPIHHRRCWALHNAYIGQCCVLLTALQTRCSCPDATKHCSTDIKASVAPESQLQLQGRGKCDLPSGSDAELREAREALPLLWVCQIGLVAPYAAGQSSQAQGTPTKLSSASNDTITTKFKSYRAASHNSSTAALRRRTEAMKGALALGAPGAIKPGICF